MVGSREPKTVKTIEREAYPADKMGEAEIILISRPSAIVFAVALIGEVLGGGVLILGA